MIETILLATAFLIGLYYVIKAAVKDAFKELNEPKGVKKDEK